MKRENTGEKKSADDWNDLKKAADACLRLVNSPESAEQPGKQGIVDPLSEETTLDIPLKTVINPNDPPPPPKIDHVSGSAHVGPQPV